MEKSSDNFSVFDLAKEKNQLIKMLSLTRIWISILSGGLVLIFGWLKLKGVSIIPLTTDSAARFLLSGSMVLYYFSWVFGASWDAKDQALVYLTAPNKGRIPIMAMGLMVILTVVFAILCWVDTYKKFAMVLGVFWFVNLIAWQFLVRKLSRRTIAISSAILLNSGHHMELAKLNIIREYIDGSWEWWRFIVGGLFILCINILANTDIPHYIKAATNVLSDEFVMVFSIALFIAIVELWMWLMRIKRRISLGILDDLNDEYDLQPK